MTHHAGVGNAGCSVIWGAGDAGGVEFLNGLLKSSLSGESEHLRLEGVLGIHNDVWVIKCPLVLGCVCQLRLKTCCKAWDTVELESDRWCRTWCKTDNTVHGWLRRLTEWCLCAGLNHAHITMGQDHDAKMMDVDVMLATIGPTLCSSATWAQSCDFPCFSHYSNSEPAIDFPRESPDCSHKYEPVVNP